MKPRIGITTWLRPLPTLIGEETLLYTLGSEYIDHVVKAGGLPLLLAHGDDPDEILDVLDGLLLTGGGDVHPQCYGEVHDGTSTGVNEQADTWEIHLVQKAAARRMPTLGICRGMQIMAVAFGGHLLQHITEAEKHPDLANLTSEEVLKQRHEVVLEPHSTIATIYATTKRKVNTIHHQAVVDAGPWHVVGWATDGTIEALEQQEQDGWPAIGVQWHPEKMQEEVEERLFMHLTKVAQRYRQSRHRDATSHL